MASIRLCIIATASLFWQTALAQSADPATVPHAVDLRLAGKADAPLVRAIARIGQSSLVTIDAGQTPRNVVESRCGIVDPTYVAVLLEENQKEGNVLVAADLDRVAPGTTLRFPACIRYQTAGYEVRPGQTIAGIYAGRGLPLDAKAVQEALSQRVVFTPRTVDSLRGLSPRSDAHLMNASNRGFTATEYARQFIEENPEVNPTVIRPGDVLQVSQKFARSTIPLKDGIALGEALHTLKNAGGTEIQVQEAAVAQVIDEVLLPAGVCTGLLPQDVWPIPIKALSEVLTKNASYRSMGAIYKPTTVLVIDTGLEPALLGRAVPQEYLGAMRSWDGKSLLKYAGVNTATLENDAAPLQGLPLASHGGEVAATLLGGRFLEAHRAKLPLPRLTFASIAQRSSRVPYLDIGAISTAYRGAIQSDIKIINASISATAKREDFVTELKQGGQSTLVIAAAGNTDSLFPSFGGQTQDWPGSMGGNPNAVAPGLVVSVGAHDPNGQLLAYSRTGKDQVDLLAPGCRIPTFSYNYLTSQLQEKDRNGTSFSAPIVSLVAALLSSEGLRPSAIKDRLIVSVDMDEELAPHVYSAGRLNIKNALSVYRDLAHHYVRDEQGSALFDSQGLRKSQWTSGVVVSGNTRVKICDEELAQKDLRKLAVTTGLQGSTLRGWRTPSSRLQGTAISRIDKCPATPALNGEMVIQTEDGKEVHIPLADIIDFVAKEPE